MQKLVTMCLGFNNTYKTNYNLFTLNQSKPTAAVAAITPILPRNSTKSPTLFIAATRRAFVTKVVND